MLTNILDNVNLENLTPQQRAELERRFQERKQQLEEALQAVNQGLETLRRQAR